MNFLVCYSLTSISGLIHWFDMNVVLGCVFTTFLCMLGMILFSGYVYLVLVDFFILMNALQIKHDYVGTKGVSQYQTLEF